MRYTASALDRIRNYDWRGNVRELKHSVEKAVILSESNIIDPDLLGLRRHDRLVHDLSVERTMEDYEKEIIARVLKKHWGNISQTASELVLSRQTLYRKIQKYGL